MHAAWMFKDVFSGLHRTSYSWKDIEERCSAQEFITWDACTLPGGVRGFSAGAPTSQGSTGE